MRATQILTAAGKSSSNGLCGELWASSTVSVYADIVALAQVTIHYRVDSLRHQHVIKREGKYHSDAIFVSSVILANSTELKR
ncbi:uncharacterized protein PHALS_02570 [Plasmopara halstedii]|uniref:Uncharacterized protein n=1 Tax=Plasmopara halstedii TaxID=4781 RepID=A0A0P1AVX4_PLAHL|nr:uncharacterized protein PHALS_02570 [Plasmopara halstedii]CEG46151.1 hypothetical protein PHALS_02570 [Plasmopara halstedii]|eukprot:XP_024582520.1 hypothetical protein PHALS_02570 [Plasmopara halstedii]